MLIDNTKSVTANILALVNAVSSKVFSEGDVTFGTPSVKAGTDQTMANNGVNSVISITGVPARGYRGTSSRDYRRIPLNAPVGGPPAEFNVPVGTTLAGLFAMVAAERRWHPGLQYTASPSPTGSLGPSGTTGTIVFTAHPNDPLHIGQETISYRVG